MSHLSQQSKEFLLESYRNATNRVTELNSPHKQLASHSAINTTDAVSLYTGIASLLYHSIHISKSDDLERMIRKKSKKIPKYIFDLEEWAPALEEARNVRQLYCQGNLQGAKQIEEREVRAELEETIKSLSKQCNSLKIECKKKLRAMDDSFKSFKNMVTTTLVDPIAQLEKDNIAIDMARNHAVAEARFLTVQLNKSRADYEEEKNKCQIYEKNIAELNSITAELRNEIDNEHQALSESKSYQQVTTEKLKALEIELNETNTTKESLENELQKLHIQLHELQETQSNLSLLQIQEEKNESQQEIKRLSDLNSQLEKSLSEYTNKVSEIEKEMAVLSREKQMKIDELQVQYQAVVESKSNKSSKLQEYENKLKQLQKELDDLQNKLISSKKKREEEKSRHINEINVKNTEIGHLHEQLAAANKRDDEKPFFQGLMEGVMDVFKNDDSMQEANPDDDEEQGERPVTNELDENDTDTSAIESTEEILSLKKRLVVSQTNYIKSEAELKKTIQELEHTLKVLQESNSSIESELTVKSNQVNELQQLLHELMEQRKVEKAENEKQVISLKTHHQQEISQHTTNITAEISDKYKQEMEKLEHELLLQQKLFEEEKAKLSHKLLQSETEEGKLRSHFQESMKQIDSLTSKSFALELEVSSLNDVIASLQDQLAVLQSDLSHHTTSSSTALIGNEVQESNNPETDTDNEDIPAELISSLQNTEELLSYKKKYQLSEEKSSKMESDLKDRIGSLEAELSALKENKTRVENELSTLKMDNDQVVAESTLQSQQIQDLQSQWKQFTHDKEKEIELLKLQLMECQTELSQLKILTTTTTTKDGVEDIPLPVVDESMESSQETTTSASATNPDPNQIAIQHSEEVLALKRKLSITEGMASKNEVKYQQDIQSLQQELQELSQKKIEVEAELQEISTKLKLLDLQCHANQESFDNEKRKDQENIEQHRLLIDSLTSQVNDKTIEYQSLQNTLTDSVNKKESELKLLEEQNHLLQNRCDQLQAELTANTTKLQESEIQLGNLTLQHQQSEEEASAKYKMEIEKLEQELLLQQKLFEEEKVKLSHKLLQSETEEGKLRSHFQESMKQIDSLTSKSFALELEVSSLNDVIASLQDQLAVLQSDLSHHTTTSSSTALIGNDVQESYNPTEQIEENDKKASDTMAVAVAVAAEEERLAVDFIINTEDSLQLKKKIQQSTKETEDLNHQILLLSNDINRLKQQETVNVQIQQKLKTDLEALQIQLKESDVAHKLELTKAKESYHDNLQRLERIQQELIATTSSQAAAERALILKMESENNQSHLAALVEMQKMQEKVSQAEREMANIRVDLAEKYRLDIDALRDRQNEEIAEIEAKHQDLLDRAIRRKEHAMEGLLLRIGQLAKRNVELQGMMQSEMIRHKIQTTPRLNGPFTPQVSQKILKLQAVVRGYIARISTKRMRIHASASNYGVLEAMPGTVQGETGWYNDHAGFCYYFILEEGEYHLACGPIPPDVYQHEVKKKYGKADVTVLSRCSFDLVANSPDLGDLYIARRTQKLFLAVPVDSYIFDYLSEMGDNDSEKDVFLNSGIYEKMDDDDQKTK